jgi:hypothetical protein
MHLCGMHDIAKRSSMDAHGGRKYEKNNMHKARQHRPAIPKAEGLTEPLPALLCNHIVEKDQAG